MACRSVNNLRLSRDDMRRVYREQARGKKGGVKIDHLIKILEIIAPIIPEFFKKSERALAFGNANGSFGNMCGMGAGDDDMPFHGGHIGHRHGHGHHHGHGSGHVARAEDYGDRVISEEEFERLLDFAEECNIKMY